MQSRLDVYRDLLKHMAGKDVTAGGEPKDAESLERQAREKLYLNDKQEPCLPAEHVWGCLLRAAGDFRIQGRRGKSYRSAFASFVTVKPKLSPISPPNWEIDLRSTNNRYAGRVPTARPLFPGGWKASFQLVIQNGQMTDETVKKVLEHGGNSVGLGSYRPTHEGPFGRFMVRQFESA